METYNKTKIIKRLQDSPHILITPRILKEYAGIVSESTLYRLILDLVESDILGKLERGKYFLNDDRVDDFVKANILFSPSYISFETALNHHGILSQFPYETTSATPKKSKTKKIDGKVYSYVHIKKSFYWGYIKQGNYLIAEPEKALLDQLYLSSKGIKGQAIDEYDYETLDMKKFWKYAKAFPQTAKFKSLLERLKDAVS
ncbi:MAG: hypothetical protein COY80_04360 [Candidatus Pacebacteria bacterium CG_4_10_14_0_8_um_filter_42_14]|nr:MAG: hypothetical protein COY80_04360 [Candidatus Pacebacteria bacterium CG_4_10_14_0_8_um_filter_42_14]